MTRAVAPRLTWAVETLGVRPEDDLLEIGCGSGAAVALICERLGGGTIVALDRSSPMIALARTRNREHLRAGKVVLMTTPLLDARFGERRFDKVFAFNVSLFWRHSAGALPLIRSVLKPGGQVYLFHQPPPARDARVGANRLTVLLKEHAFEVLEMLCKPLHPAPAICVIATQSGDSPRDAPHPGAA